MCVSCGSLRLLFSISTNEKIQFSFRTGLYFCYVIIKRLFTFYIAVVLLVPCSDAQACTEMSKVHQEDAHEKDICPPFCICQCCHTAVEEINYFAWSTTNPKPLDTWSEIVIQSPNAPLHNIWQPPR